MNKTKEIRQSLLYIGQYYHNKTEEDDDGEQKLSQFTLAKTFEYIQNLQQSELLKPFKFTNRELQIIGCAWYRLIIDRNQYFDPLELLYSIFENPAKSTDKLNLITDLLKKNVFYTSRKKVLQSKEPEHLFGGPQTQIQYHQSSLLENDVYFHRSFVKLLLNEEEKISKKTSEPYTSNKEYLSDWFAYVHQLWEFSMYDFTDRKYNGELSEGPTNDLMKAMEWKYRIESRLQNTTEVFPLMDISDEYKLDHNETIIMAYLVKEDMEGNNVENEEVLKLVSRDHHELYMNKQYIAGDSKLVRHGIIELSENVFFRSKGGELRISPDITRQIIMKTPVSDSERLNQVLNGNEIFSLLEPTHTIDDLILPKEMKKTIMTSLKRYEKNVDQTLCDWQLFEGGTARIDEIKKKTEPGLLMLFHGLPGTGKTFASAAIAQALGKKLLVTDMSRIQSKWVGESEKNVRRLFTIFERIVRRTDNPPVLLLNEADQFLTRRLNKTGSSVDVMYNTLQNLFLEAFEHFKGVMIATTNLKDNLDPAFSRRFNLKLEFPLPEYVERMHLWKLHLPKTIPGVDEIDVKELAREYSFTGGQISIVVKNAATEAAGRKGKYKKLTQSDLVKYSVIESLSMFDRKKCKMGFVA